MSDLWDAPLAHGPVSATVDVPGSKSITNRALLLGALGTGESVIDGALLARDTRLMIAGLTALGTGFQVTEPAGADGAVVRVQPSELAGPARIDCGLAGTLMRFLPPAAALASGPIDFDGDVEARRRPVAPLLGALRDLGIRVEGDSLPFRVEGAGRVAGGEVSLDASQSSQFVSGLLLAGARYEQGVLVRHVGDRLPSLPHVEMTVGMLAGSGARVLWDVADPRACWWQVEPGPIRLGEIRVEPDLTNAAVFLAAAMVTGGNVTVPHWPGRTTQAGDRIRHVLDAMGGRCAVGAAGLSVVGPGRIEAIDVDLRDAGELVPTVAAVCLFATGTSTLRGIGHLRGHETDRIAALVTEIERLGGKAEAGADSITITPARLHGAVVESYADHRMATFAAIVGLAVPGVRVRGIDATSKTIPDFVYRWARMLGDAG